MKKEFTSTLSHELRTPLTSIIGSLQLINSGVMGEVDREVGELTEVAERNGQRLLDLINDILDIEKIESGKLTLAPGGDAVDELVREAMVLNQAFAERFKVRFEARGDLPRAQGARRPQAPAAGDDQPAVQRGQVLARGRRGGNQHRGRRPQRAHRGARPRPRHSGGFPQPHLRALHPGRLDRHAPEGRHAAWASPSASA